MRNTFYFTLCAIALCLTCCYMPIIEGAQQTYDAASRGPLQNKARAGDPVAQYEFANTYCCKGSGPLKEASIYDNNKATYWYCKSAKQGNANSQLKLAKIYSGDPMRGLHLVLRGSNLVGTNPTNLSVAQMWADVAARKGDEDAIELRDEIKKNSTVEEQKLARAYLEDWQNAPCNWSVVFPKKN